MQMGPGTEWMKGGCYYWCPLYPPSCSRQIDLEAGPGQPQGCLRSWILSRSFIWFCVLLDFFFFYKRAPELCKLQLPSPLNPDLSLMVYCVSWIIKSGLCWLRVGILTSSRIQLLTDLFILFAIVMKSIYLIPQIRLIPLGPVNLCR